MQTSNSEFGYQPVKLYSNSTLKLAVILKLLLLHQSINTVILVKVLVIGSGLFGCCTAIELANAGFKVELIDAEKDIMQKASRVNHNRIHLGYHYLRSVETAEQSIEGLLSFMFNYGHAVENQFLNYYAIAKNDSKTTPDEFLSFCNKVGIGYDYEYPINDLFEKNMLSACFKVPEPVFDYSLLKEMVKGNLVKSKINVSLNSTLTSLSKSENGYSASYGNNTNNFDAVINASYANFNSINAMLGIPLKKLLFEQVVIPEFEYQSSPFGLTVMDGEFCSVMPKGKRENEFLLYHVKDSVLKKIIATERPEFSKNLNNTYENIYQNSSLFMPFLKNVKMKKINEVTRVVHENDDDARLTELFTYEGFDNYFALLSGKITTCVQVALEVKHVLQGRDVNRRMKI